MDLIKSEYRRYRAQQARYNRKFKETAGVDMGIKPMTLQEFAKAYFKVEEAKALDE